MFATALAAALAVSFTAQAADPAPIDLSREWIDDKPPPTAGPSGTPIKVTSKTPTAVTMSFKRSGYCSCEERELHVALDHSYACASSTLSFDYHADSSTPLPLPHGAVVAIGFCRGDDCSPLFRADDGTLGFGSFVGTTEVGGKQCLRDRRGLASVPRPTIHEGSNVVDLSKLEPFVNGRCEGYFDAVEIHVMASSCDEKARTITLSNMRIAGPEASPSTPPPPPPPPPPASLPVAPPAPPAPPPAETAEPRPYREPLYTEVHPRGYAAYAIGGGSSNQSTFRQGLDVSLGAMFLKGRSPQTGAIFGATLNTGFGASPTYVAIDGGYTLVSYLGYFFTVGPAMRVAPNVAYGVEASAMFLFFGLIHGGVRAIGVFGSPFDAQIQALLGVGLY